MNVSSSSAAAWPHLVFRLSDKLYGLAAESVREIVRLPEISPLDDLPPQVAGLVNVRGRLVPVIDLEARMRTAARLWHTSDFLIIAILHDDVDIAMIANHIVGIHDLQPRQSGELDALLGDGEGGAHHGFLAGVAHIENQMVALLDCHHLLLPREQKALGEWGRADEERGDPGAGRSLSPRRFSPGSTDREHSIFRERARRLMNPLRGTDAIVAQAFVIIELHQTRLAFTMEAVRGFVSVMRMTPIPCCPEHVAGMMSRRGEMLTLVNVSMMLSLPNVARPMEKAVLVEIQEDEVLGLLVHQVVEVVYQDVDTLFVPVAPEDGPAHKLGSLRWRGQLLAVIDPAKLLRSPELVVDQAP
ncbi:MAG: chemotaxis protein CheW [Magnetococcales bacterium]|nr:chemotaxis protein CheW [Magnetococcales bacterium]